MRKLLTILAGSAALAGAGLAAPAAAEIVAADEDHFITRAEAVVEADPKATWLMLISPARWWSSEHTWSGDAANMTLTPQAGGCFCEKIPEVDEPGRFTLEGSVEHMRVLHAYPEVALRMSGALGPLQSEPVTGILTIALSEVDNGTRIVFEYNVGGQMRYPVPVISPAVDGVMTLQLTRLAELLGTVEAPAAPSAPPPPPAPAPAETEGEASSADGDPEIDSEPMPGEGSEDAMSDSAPDSAPEDTPSAVDDAFDDLADDE